MRYTFNGESVNSTIIDICDSVIESITVQDRCIYVLFESGFSVIRQNAQCQYQKGYLEIFDCAPEDFKCYLFKREASSDGAQLFGKPLSLVDLSEMLESEGRKIELYLVLSNNNTIQLRGVLLPYNRFGLSDTIVIELQTDSDLSLKWNSFQ